MRHKYTTLLRRRRDQVITAPGLAWDSSFTVHSKISFSFTRHIRVMVIQLLATAAKRYRWGWSDGSAG